MAKLLLSYNSAKLNVHSLNPIFSEYRRPMDVRGSWETLSSLDITLVWSTSVVGLEVPLGAGAGVSVDAEGSGLDVAASPPITLLSHKHHSLVQVAIH